jgi:hypothetical protein
MLIQGRQEAQQGLNATSFMLFPRLVPQPEDRGARCGFQRRAGSSGARRPLREVDDVRLAPHRRRSCFRFIFLLSCTAQVLTFAAPASASHLNDGSVSAAIGANRHLTGDVELVYRSASACPGRASQLAGGDVQLSGPAGFSVAGPLTGVVMTACVPSTKTEGGAFDVDLSAAADGTYTVTSSNCCRVTPIASVAGGAAGNTSYTATIHKSGSTVTSTPSPDPRSCCTRPGHSESVRPTLAPAAAGCCRGSAASRSSCASPAAPRPARRCAPETGCGRCQSSRGSFPPAGSSLPTRPRCRPRGGVLRVGHRGLAVRVRSAGEDRPAASDRTAAGRAENMRVEVRLRYRRGTSSG